MTEEHWTEWRDHTPGPCPVPAGTWVQAEYMDGGTLEGPASGNGGCWAALPSDPCLDPIIRYRIRQYPEASKLIADVTTKVVEPV